MDQNDNESQSAESRDIEKFRHDARNQLGLIVGYIDLLDKSNVGSLNPQQQSYVEHIRSAANTLDQMIDALLHPDEP